MADELTEYTSPVNNPAAQAAIDEALRDEPERNPRPMLEPSDDCFVTLPGGVLRSGEKVAEVEVQELDGESEERLAKARASADQSRFYNVILEEGVVSHEAALPDMLVGDREAVLLGIRKATYGPEIEIGLVFCPTCKEPFEGVVDVNDIPIRKLEGDIHFEVPLRKGGIARVRLPVGDDQNAYIKDPDLTDSERNTILLKRCVLSIKKDGDENSVAAFPSLVLSLGVMDRRNILREIDIRQPGPRYDGVEIEHEDCGTKVAAPLGLVALFPGL